MFQPAANSKDTDYSLSAGFLFNRKLRSLFSHYSADWIDISMRQEEIV